MACDRGSGRAACDKAKVLAVAIASGAAAASALLSMPTDRSEPVVAILLASHRFEGESRLFCGAAHPDLWSHVEPVQEVLAIKGVGVALRPSA